MISGPLDCADLERGIQRAEANRTGDEQDRAHDAHNDANRASDDKETRHDERNAPHCANDPVSRTHVLFHGISLSSVPAYLRSLVDSMQQQ